MSLIKKIFGSKKLVEDISSGIDKAIFTKEEKADYFSNLLDKYEPFKLAQRLLAVLITIVYLGIYIVLIFVHLFYKVKGLDDSFLFSMYEIHNDTLLTPFTLINSFYFGGGLLNSLKKT